MRATARLEGMGTANAAIAADLRARQTRAIGVGGEQLKTELRAMTQRALGDRLAKTWRLKNYGLESGGAPAAFVWSKAPDIIKGNMRGGTIVPVAGTRFLALPTEHVPRRIGGRGAKAQLSPEEVEARFNQDFIFRPGRKRGSFVALIDLNAGRLRGGRARGGRRARTQRLVHMFTFVRSARQTKTIDPDAAFERARTTTRRLLEEG